MCRDKVTKETFTSGSLLVQQSDENDDVDFLLANASKVAKMFFFFCCFVFLSLVVVVVVFFCLFCFCFVFYFGQRRAVSVCAKMTPEYIIIIGFSVQFDQ